MISKCGQILSRNGAGVIPVISDLGDGDCIFTSVLRHETLKELKKQTFDDKVLIVLDPKLLLRQDYYISSGWSYGPFKERYRRFEMGYERYFRPELRNDIRFVTKIAPSEVIPSIKTFLHDNRFGADIDRGINEVGFLNPINLNDSLIEVFP